MKKSALTYPREKMARRRDYLNITQDDGCSSRRTASPPEDDVGKHVTEKEDRSEATSRGTTPSVSEKTSGGRGVKNEKTIKFYLSRRQWPIIEHLTDDAILSM